ncbi:AimR family lysis-lysogeny pheromone receptor [Halalkalibacter akibai]|uniref:Prophage helix-turn-helix protein n=1 Tax=Halalkalibacter akibai (strain ATCC 43226 / DSM 21942 / CIP 109018 / JCM 9157 / 1139) TaxID=1236973 RepID=W4QYZ1_HALA3|nr:AimR family lysis-lysogeny pheromone receptor [Halalkalibacter akibai]GAE36509.1 prophage helix-turn-helix protein [Halalkalibacter akibai JCM 9157]
MNEFITPETFNAIDDLEEFITHVDPESYIARVALEYLVINSKSDLLEKLIEKLLTSTSEESRTWAEVYQIDHLLYKQEISLIEATKQLTYKKVKSDELATLIKVFQLYNYYDLKNFEMRASLSSLVAVEIPQLIDGFMKNSLLCREKLIMQGVHLHLNEVEESRKCGLELLENALTPSMKAIAYNLLGISYIICNKDMALENFHKSIDLAKNLQNNRMLDQAQISMNFTYCYWNETDKLKEDLYELTSLNNKQGFAFYLIKTGKKNEALKILDDIDLKIDNDYLKAFDQYYRGLISGERLYFQKSTKYFELAGNLYFRQLPLNELNRIN